MSKIDTPKNVRKLAAEYDACGEPIGSAMLTRYAALIEAVPLMANEMARYLPIIERAEAAPEVWSRLTEGTGIATANGYRDAIAKATGQQP